MKISDYTAQNPVCTLSELMLCGTDEIRAQLCAGARAQ